MPSVGPPAGAPELPRARLPPPGLTATDNTARGNPRAAHSAEAKGPAAASDARLQRPKTSSSRSGHDFAPSDARYGRSSGRHRSVH